MPPAAAAAAARDDASRRPPTPPAPTGGSHPWFEPVSWQPRAFVAHNFASQEETDHIIKLAQPLVRLLCRDAADRQEGAPWPAQPRLQEDLLLLACNRSCSRAAVCRPEHSAGMGGATPARCDRERYHINAAHPCRRPSLLLSAAQAQHGCGCWRTECGGHVPHQLRHVHQVCCCWPLLGQGCLRLPGPDGACVQLAAGVAAADATRQLSVVDATCKATRWPALPPWLVVCCSAGALTGHHLLMPPAPVFSQAAPRPHHLRD